MCFLFKNLTQEATTYGDFSMSVKQIERVHEFTYLGVVFDERLSWGSHVKKVISKAGKRVGMLGRLRNNLMTHSANVAVVKEIVRP